MKHWFIRNREICPRCGYDGFHHGFFPNDEYYCGYCHLWEPVGEMTSEYSKRVIKEAAGIKPQHPTGKRVKVSNYRVDIKTIDWKL